MASDNKAGMIHAAVLAFLAIWSGIDIFSKNFDKDTAMVVNVIAATVLSIFFASVARNMLWAASKTFISASLYIAYNISVMISIFANIIVNIPVAMLNLITREKVAYFNLSGAWRLMCKNSVEIILQWFSNGRVELIKQLGYVLTVAKEFFKPVSSQQFAIYIPIVVLTLTSLWLLTDRSNMRSRKKAVKWANVNFIYILLLFTSKVCERYLDTRQSTST